MVEVAVAEAKNRLSELLARAAAGEVIGVTRHGRLVACLVPPPQQEQAEQVAEAFARLTELGRGVTLDGDIKQIAREGLD